uniref:Uncharacterized protein n=1 Tax=Ananas comosus var. bracteatus TaxID=296719 RepID=A0A6V7Q0K6_ANACO|nr:unnamed protein product [Ananas comosus var. bracteatus]
MGLPLNIVHETIACKSQQYSFTTSPGRVTMTLRRSNRPIDRLISHASKATGGAIERGLKPQEKPPNRRVDGLIPQAAEATGGAIERGLEEEPPNRRVDGIIPQAAEATGKARSREGRAIG